MKLKYKEIKRTGLQDKQYIKSYYITKYYGIFLSSYVFKNLSEQENHYLLKRFWKDGTVASFIVPNSKPITIDNELKGANTSGVIAFCPYAVMKYNLYDFPSIVNLINQRAVDFIPQTPQLVNKDVIIGYANTSHTPVMYIVDFYAEKLAEVELTINTNLFVHKLPRLVIVSPEDEERVRELMNAIENNEPKLFLDAEDFNAIKNVLDSGGSYIIDKLYQYKQSLENELLTYLGIDNIGLEKRERLIVDEANANNDFINDNSDNFLSTMKSFCENIRNILGFEISVEAKSSPVKSESQNMNKDNKENNDNEI